MHVIHRIRDMKDILERKFTQLRRNKKRTDLRENEIRTYISEPDRGRRDWEGKSDEQAAVSRRTARGSNRSGRWPLKSRLGGTPPSLVPPPIHYRRGRACSGQMRN
jgi:hypothetical protein